MGGEQLPRGCGVEADGPDEVVGVVAGDPVEIGTLAAVELVGVETGRRHETVDIEAGILGDHVRDIAQTERVPSDGVERATGDAVGDDMRDDEYDKLNVLTPNYDDAFKAP